MFTSISNFLRRHRRKILIAGGLVTAGVFLKRYAHQKFLEWEAKQTQAYLEQLKRHHHFEGTVQTCDSTALSLSSKVKETISKTLHIESFLADLKSDPPNKVPIWEELKVLIFSHAVGEIVCECLLVVYLRVQLSILGGYMYVDSQRQNMLEGVKGNEACSSANHHLPNSASNIASTAVQQRYLSLINHFFNEGVAEVLKAVVSTVRIIIGPIGLKTGVRLRDFDQELASIKARLFTSEIFQANFLSRCFLSPEAQTLVEATTDPSQSSDFVIRKMVSETKDILESRDFEKVVVACMDRGVSRIMDLLLECFVHLSAETKDKFTNPNNVSVPMAKLLPVLRSVLTKQNPQEMGSYLQQLLQLEILKNFSANIYEAFSQPPPCENAL